MGYKYYLIIFSALFLFFSFILHINIPDTNHKYQDIDSKAYIGNAINFYNYNNFSKPDNPKATPYYSLGYAFFLGVIYKLFGINNFVVVWIQIFLTLFTAFLIFKITGYLFNEKIAVLAFVFTCLNLGFLTFSLFILTEILLTFFLVLFLERFVLFFKTQNIVNLLQSGFCLGFSIIVKPAALYFIFFLILVLLVSRSCCEGRISEGLFLFIKRRILSKIRIIGLFCFSFYLPVTGYMFFNKIQYGNFGVAPLANEALYFYLFPKVLAKKNNTDVLTEIRKLGSLLTGSKFSKNSWKKINELFLKNLKEDPFIFIKIWLKNVLKTYLGLFTTNLKVLLDPNVRGGDISFFKTKGRFLKRIWDYINGGTNSVTIKIVGLIESLWSLIRYFFCLIAIIFLAIKKRWLELFLFSGYVFYFAMITGHDGCARFRMMFEPVLIILSSVGCWIFVKEFRDLL